MVCLMCVGAILHVVDYLHSLSHPHILIHLATQPDGEEVAGGAVVDASPAHATTHGTQRNCQLAILVQFLVTNYKAHETLQTHINILVSPSSKVDTRKNKEDNLLHHVGTVTSSLLISPFTNKRSEQWPPLTWCCCSLMPTSFTSSLRFRFVFYSFCFMIAVSHTVITGCNSSSCSWPAQPDAGLQVPVSKPSLQDSLTVLYFQVKSSPPSIFFAPCSLHFTIYISINAGSRSLPASLNGTILTCSLTLFTSDICLTTYNN